MLRLRGVSYQHPTAPLPAVNAVDLVVSRGELVLLTGPTGCGKSTLLRLAAGLLQRHGRGTFAGSVTVNGEDVAAMAPSVRVRHVALVGQDPDDQRVSATVGDEIAFAAESARFAAEDVEAAVAELLRALDLPGGPLRRVEALSSGQRQRLSVAAALSAGAGLLLLDEPLAHLDPQSARELVERLRALATAGAAVLIVEHRLEPLWRVADRCVVMNEGRILADAPPAQIAIGVLRGLGLAVPGGAPRLLSSAPRPAEGPPILVASSVSFRFPTGEGLDAMSLTVRGGERVALVGPNGAGKSTLLRALAGDLGGAVAVRGRLVSVPPNPDLGLFCPTVREELEYAARELGFSGVEERTANLAEAFSLGGLMARPPQALSRGQRLRVSVAAALAAEPAVLLLDEPTSGQDLGQVERLMEAVAATLTKGVLVFATHDLPLALRYATRVVVLCGGRVVADGDPDATLLTGGDWQQRESRLTPIDGSPTQSGAHAPRTLDPRTRLALVGLVGVLAVCFDGPVALGALAALCAVAFLRFGPDRRTLLGAFGVLLGITWSTVLAQGLFYGDEPRVALLHLGALTLWRQGVAHGLVQSLRFVSMTLAGFALAASTPPERLFAGLRALRVPFGLAFLVVTALRFVPDVAGEWQAVRVARSRRGRPAWRRAPWAWLALEVSLLTPVLARTLRRARSLAESLDSRGFDPASPRAIRRPLVLRGLDWSALGAATVIGGIALVSRTLFMLYTSDTWYHPALRGLYATVRSW